MVSQSGGDGDDTLRAPDVFTVMTGDQGADTFIGGAGTETVSYETAVDTVTITLDGINNDDDGQGGNDNVGTDIDIVRGGSAARLDHRQRDR